MTLVLSLVVWLLVGFVATLYFSMVKLADRVEELERRERASGAGSATDGWSPTDEPVGSVAAR
jgi:hypothetical protein